jgi:4-alpha-glucanotransferase
VVRDRVAGLRRTTRVDYEGVRVAKREALSVAFDHFMTTAADLGSARLDAFEAFVEREAWWLDTYALFRALHEEHHSRYWREWEAGLRDRDPSAMEAARRRLARPVRYYQYLQWLAGEQWREARAACGAVGLFGDFPFMVNGHSADVWARQAEFHLDASVGVPPAAGSPEGQDWGLPAYRWDVVAAGGYAWLAERTRRCAELFDAFRVDHLVGFYRTFIRARDGVSGFSPAGEPAQIAQGEALMSIFRAHGSCIIAEDLGVVPDFARESQLRRQVPGLTVLRWEREWEEAGRPFRDPRGYAPCSVAISGTHDTESMAEWWDGADDGERRAVIPILAGEGHDLAPDEPFSARVRDALLGTLFHAASDFALIDLADIFGWRDRINTPSSVNDENWTWRLPWPVDTLTTSPEATARAAFLRSLAVSSHRT